MYFNTQNNVQKKVHTIKKVGRRRAIERLIEVVAVIFGRIEIPIELIVKRLVVSGAHCVCTFRTTKTGARAV